MIAEARSARLGTHSARLGVLVLGVPGPQKLGRPAEMRIGQASAGQTAVATVPGAPVITDARYFL